MPFTYTINENESGTYLTRQNGDGTTHYSTDGGHTWTDVAPTVRVQPWMNTRPSLSETLRELFGFELAPKRKKSPFQQWEEGLNNG